MRLKQDIKSLGCNNIIINDMRVVELMNKMYKFHNPTYWHCIRVMIITCAFMNNYYDSEMLSFLAKSALLHDIGKLYIPDDILNKNSALTEEEWLLMRNHAMYSYDILKDYEFEETVCIGARDHHEKMNGSGYPSGLNGYTISEFGRIISVFDVFDALTHKRSYKEAETLKMSINIMSSMNGFDLNILSRLESNAKTNIIILEE